MEPNAVVRVNDPDRNLVRRRQIFAGRKPKARQLQGAFAVRASHLGESR
jgi:hypothetical protein